MSFIVHVGIVQPGRRLIAKSFPIDIFSSHWWFKAVNASFIFILQRYTNSCHYCSMNRHIVIPLHLPLQLMFVDTPQWPWVNMKSTLHEDTSDTIQSASKHYKSTDSIHCTMTSTYNLINLTVTWKSTFQNRPTGPRMHYIDKWGHFNGPFVLPK